MGKVSEYTILDDSFYETLSSFAEELDRNKIQYALVGGAAVQSKIASVLSKNGKMSLNDIGGLDFLVRKTGDLDIALDNISDERLVELFNSYNALNPPNKHLHPVTNKSLRTRKDININLETCPEDFKGLPKSYSDIVYTSEPIVLRKGNNYAHISIAKPEYLVASKLTRLAEKDRIDIYNLIKTMHGNKEKFGFEEVKNILKANAKEDRIDFLKEIHFEIIK